jgi:uncharacterized damage-inducible protein DinB
MTLQEAKTLHAFNAWATNRLMDALAKLPEEQYLRDMRSSHGNIHNTLAHLISAEQTWLARMTGTPDARLPETVQGTTLAELRKVWEKVGYDMARFLGELTDKKLSTPFTMKTSQGVTYTHTFAQALQHVVDHATYHRGQVITMMRQMGVVPPNTGMMTYYREISR